MKRDDRRWVGETDGGQKMEPFSFSGQEKMYYSDEKIRVSEPWGISVAYWQEPVEGTGLQRGKETRGVGLLSLIKDSLIPNMAGE